VCSASSRCSFRFNDEIGDALALLRARPEIAGVVTHVVSLEDDEGAFAVARRAQESGKVLLDLAATRVVTLAEQTGDLTRDTAVDKHLG